MIEKYNAEIRENRELLAAITVAMNQLIKMSSAGKDGKVVNKQRAMFEKLRQAVYTDKFNKKYSAYEKNSYKNLQNLKSKYPELDLSKVRDVLQSNSRRFNYDIINKVMDILERNHSLDQKMIVLSQRYKDCINKIKHLEEMIEFEKQRQANKEQEVAKKETEPRKKTESSWEEIEEHRKNKKIQEIGENADVLLRGPKKGGLISSLQGKDMLFKDMEYLYGLAIDILYLMNKDQRVNQKETAYGKEARVWNAGFETISSFDEKYQAILSSYGVSSIEALLNKYDKIRNTYYKKFSKLSKDNKAKYAIENFHTFDISSGLSGGIVGDSVLNALKNEKLEFPPSKDMLISYMNKRILNGKNYDIVSPKNEEVITAAPQDYQEYDKKRKYYKNLTKNMTEEQIVMLYHHVVQSMYDGFKYSELDENTKAGYYAVMQKLFCEVIFEKRGMKFSDSKQHDTALDKIAKEVLKEDLKFSIYGHNNVNEDEKTKRQSTIQKEYIKYRAQLTAEGKKEFMSFREFVQQKYALSYVEEPENLNELIEEEIKGMKK